MTEKSVCVLKKIDNYQKCPSVVSKEFKESCNCYSQVKFYLKRHNL